MQHILVKEISRLTTEIKRENPLLEKYLKELPMTVIEKPGLHEQQLKEHLSGLKMILENYRRS